MAYGAQQQILDASEAEAVLAKTGRDTNSVMAGWVDRGPYFYYDRLKIAAGTQLASSYQMFAVQTGALDPQTSTVKTLQDTNMVRGNQFPPPRCLLLMGIGFYFSPTMSLADIASVTDGAIIQFRIDEKIFHEGQLYMYPSGAGIYGVTTQTGESSYTNGIANPLATRRYGEWAKYIAPIQQFSMTILFPAATTPLLSSTGAGLIMTAFLDGLTDRSVQ